VIARRGDVVFSLSGRIDKENIAELEALIGAEGRDRRIVLDLKDMTLTGEDGMNFLAQCEAAGVALVNCDPYPQLRGDSKRSVGQRIVRPRKRRFHRRVHTNPRSISDGEWGHSLSG
jgi:hypothetical protein